MRTKTALPLDWWPADCCAEFRCTKAFRLVQLKHLPVHNMVVRGQQGQYLDEVGGLSGADRA
jgi:hypothetical protein